MCQRFCRSTHLFFVWLQGVVPLVGLCSLIEQDCYNHQKPEGESSFRSALQRRHRMKCLRVTRCHLGSMLSKTKLGRSMFSTRHEPEQKFRTFMAMDTKHPKSHLVTCGIGQPWNFAQVSSTSFQELSPRIGQLMRFFLITF